MTLVRIVPLLAVYLCIQLSVCQLGSTSGSTSLWGKKLQFRGRGCVWQLHPDVAVPALKDLSVCILLYHNISSEWTGFVYKAPGENKIELGLGGKGHKLFVWLFGEKWSFDKELKLHEWCSVCLTWSGPTRRLRVYSNGTKLNETSMSATAPHQLTPNGTLTLGVSHFQNPDGGVRPESGNNLLGEIARFRMWAREWSDEEMRRPSCAEGDVLSWDQRLWTSQCLPKTDNNMQCEWPIYKITMLMSVFHIKRPGNCSVPLEAITREWLGSVFPHSFSVRGILVSSPGRTCQLVNKSSAPQQPQGLATLSNSTCDSCFSCKVHVVVDPAAKVDEVQRNITAWLSPTFSQELFNLTADPSSISVVPAELMSTLSTARPPPTVSIFTSSIEVGPTQSLPAHSADVSTTEEPIDVNETLVEPDTFFRVNLTLNMSGAPPDPKQIIEKWVKERLEINKTMTVVNLIIMDGDVWRNMEQYEGLMAYNDQHNRYRCAFHVQEYNKHNVNVTELLIKGALTSRYENGSTKMEVVDLKIGHIVPGNCLEDLQSTIYGEYFWVETFTHVVQEMECEQPRFQRAYRLCKLDMETDKARWAKPNMTNCTPLVSISDLANITVTTDNVDEVVGMIQDLVNDQLGADAKLPASELNTVVEKLKQVVDVGTIEPPLAGDIVGVVADILLSETDMAPVANIVLNLTDKMGNNMDFPGESISFTAPALALSMVNVDPDGFWGLTFGVSSMSVSQRPKIFLNPSFENEALPDTAATISLPSALASFLRPQDGKKSRIQFQFYGSQDLFQDPQLTNATPSSWTLNSCIVSASINGSHVTNLKDKVVVTLQHKKPKQPHHKVECMFWDFQNNGGQGGWSSRGCETSNISPNQTRCLCDHLTHFAVLLDVSRTPISEADNQILTVISYLGCGISSIFLGITLLTYLAFEKLRRDHPSRILINLSAALFGLSMVFLLDSWLSSFSNYGLCIATAATLHYFFLASFTWMGLEAVHMYLALVKVFNIYVPSYILKICAAGWGIPLLIVSTILAVDKDAYGNVVPEKTVVLQSSDPFCWLQNNVYFYVTVVAFALLILLCNLSVFVVVLVQIRRMRANKPSAKGAGPLHDFRAVASLTVLLGLTWSMGFFSFGPGKVVMMYLFSIFNSLQGFFVFLFHCLMKENVRKQWRDHLCCGRYRPGDYSDWSRSVTAGGRRKKNNLVNSESVASDNTSTLRKVSDSSTGSAPDHHKGA